MHFNIYLDDETAERLKAATAQTQESRNSLIRKAIKSWLDQSQAEQWPAEVLEFEGVESMASFESTRDELLPANEDPLA
jgi:predicted transcriptional regulator